MELDLKTIGSRIRALRKQHGWTQEALAERADLSVPFLSHIERGKKSAGLSTLIKLAAALDTTVDFLLFESPPAVPLVLCPDIHTLLADCSEQELQIIYETTVTLKRLLRAYPPIWKKVPPLNEEIYLAMVDNTMKKLRAICLGQDAPLTSILPQHLKDQPAAQQAEMIADQLLFALAKTDHSTSSPQQLADSRLWLRDTTLYLLTERGPSSQTFEELKSIGYIGGLGAKPPACGAQELYRPEGWYQKRYKRKFVPFLVPR